jgi:hypothetical protein
VSREGRGAAVRDPLREAFRLGASHPGARPPFWTTVALLGTAAAACAVVVTTLVDVAAGFGARLFEPPVPTGDWLLEWSPRAAPPSAEQQRQVLALSRVGAGVGALVTILSATLLVGLWRQRLRLGENEYSLHRSLGARRAQRAARLAGEAAPWAAAATLVSLALAALIPFAVALTFPGEVRLSPLAGASLILLTALGALVLSLEVRAGGRGAARGSAGALVQAPLSSSPGAIIALGFAALSGVGLLARHAPHVSAGTRTEGALAVVHASLAGVPAERRGGVAAAWLAEARARGLMAGLASTGTVRGTGFLEMVLTDCGNCSEGGLPLPIHVVRAEVFALAPDTFAHVGLSLVEGRDFGAEADAEGAGVAIVSRSLAGRHFERGRGIGRAIRVGGSEWMTVIGIVSDRADSGATRDYSVYLPISRAAPSEVEIVVAGAAPSLDPIRESAPPGVRLGPVRSPAEIFAAHAWFRRLIAALGGGALALVFLGTWIAGADESRALGYEIALRKAVGATPRQLRGFVAAAGARQLLGGMLVGAWLSLFAGAGLTKAYGAIPQVDFTVWLWTAALAASGFIVGSLPHLRRALRAAPVADLAEVHPT